MKIEEYEEDGRLYKALSDGGKQIIIGPPHGLVDELNLPEPVATRLHNILYKRGMHTYADVQARSKELIGALQELYSLDVQKLTEIFFRYEKE